MAHKKGTARIILQEGDPRWEEEMRKDMNVRNDKYKCKDTEYKNNPIVGNFKYM